MIVLPNIDEQQLAIFTKGLERLSFGKCEACGGIGYLEVHHWHEDADIVKFFSHHRKGGLKEHQKRICRLCNTGRNHGGLYRDTIKAFAAKRGYHCIGEFRDGDFVVNIRSRKSDPWIWSHILPPWEIQRDFIQSSIKPNEREQIDTMPLVWNELHNATGRLPFFRQKVIASGGDPSPGIAPSRKRSHHKDVTREQVDAQGKTRRHRLSLDEQIARKRGRE